MKKEIPFDPSLIGKEGITVLYRNGEKPDFVKWYINGCDEYPIASVSNKGEVDTHIITGEVWEANMQEYHIHDLLMYKEVKEMTGEEWVNDEYPSVCNQSIFSNYDMAIAFDAGAKMIKEIHGIK